MNPLGVHALVFVGGWSDAEADRAIGAAAEHGYGILEIPLLEPEKVDARRTAQKLERAGIRPVASLGLDLASDISSEDSEAVARGEAKLGLALAVARDLGASMLTGVLYSALAKYGTTASEAGRRNCVRVLSRLAGRAAEAGMTLGLEPVNRYESNLVNTAEQALALIAETGADNIHVHLDSFHMNIEEADPAAAIERCGTKLGYFHVNESHRGRLGTGTIDFSGMFAALARTGYGGGITFEAFSAGIGDPKLNAELAIWRTLWTDSDALARHAREFMAAQWNAAQRRIV